MKGSRPSKDPTGLRSCEIRQAFSWLNRVYDFDQGLLASI